MKCPGCHKTLDVIGCFIDDKYYYFISVGKNNWLASAPIPDIKSENFYCTYCGYSLIPTVEKWHLSFTDKQIMEMLL